VMPGRMAGLAAISIAALALAACSSSTSGASSATGQVTGSPVTVGVIGSFSGALASSTGGVPEIMQAWASSVNAGGGLLGHPVKVVAADDAGVRLVLSTAVSASAADYTAVCQSVASSGAQSMYVAAGNVVQVRVAAACATQGAHVKLVDGGGLNETILGKPGSDGAAAALANAPWFDDSVPATKAYHDAVAKYAPGLGDLNGPNTMSSWASGELFEAAVRASGSSDITPASVRAGLLKLKGETLGGLVQPLTYSADKPTLLNCWFETRVVNGKWTEPNGLTPACAPAPVIDGIAAKLGLGR
jgi:branched-chain amino acid transport system substrate-binding protein